MLVLERLQEPKLCQQIINRRIAEMVPKLSKHKSFKGWFDDYVSSEISAFFDSADHCVEVGSGKKPDMAATQFPGPLMKMTGNERAEVLLGVLKTAAQRHYRARKRNEKKKAKKAAAKAAAEESDEVQENQNENSENRQPKVEEEGVSTTDL